MKKLKSIALAIMVSASTGLSINANAGVPVVDAGSIAQAIIQVNEMRNQIQNQIVQIKSLENQYKAMTGSRNLGELFNNPALKSYLPNDYAKLYDAVKSGNAGQVGSAISNLQKQEKSYGQNSAIQRKQTEILMQKAVSTQGLEAQVGRLNNIEKLMGQINHATDAKASADLMNRISIESAMVQAEANRIALMAQLNQANQKLAEQQAVQQSKDRLLRGGRLPTN